MLPSSQSPATKSMIVADLPARRDGEMFDAVDDAEADWRAVVNP